jgi:hypothetical protein
MATTTYWVTLVITNCFRIIESIRYDATAQLVLFWGEVPNKRDELLEICSLQREIRYNEFRYNEVTCTC